MNRPILFSFLFISLASSFDKSQSSQVDTTIAKSADTIVKSQIETYTDSTVKLFGGSSYKLALHIFDTSINYEAETKNAMLTFSRQNGNQIKILLCDSIFCIYPNIEFKDFNNDNIKDIIVLCYTGARANPTYHLYLTDQKNRKLIRVKGFESLPNPNLDTAHNIIESVALSGTNYYSFYRINSYNKLINLGHGFEGNFEDSTQYERAIRQILEQYK